MVKTISFTQIKYSRRFVELVCFIQVLVFAYTGFSKLADHHNFQAQLALVFPWPLIAAGISYAVPVAEIIIALLIIAHRTRAMGMYLFLFLLILFSTYIFFLLQSGISLPCTCGGVINSLTWQQHFVFNCVLVVLSIAGIYVEYKLYHSHKPYS